MIEYFNFLLIIIRWLSFMIVICLDRETCPSSVNSELLRISELKNQYQRRTDQYKTNEN